MNNESAARIKARFDLASKFLSAQGDIFTGHDVLDCLLQKLEQHQDALDPAANGRARQKNGLNAIHKSNKNVKKFYKSHNSGPLMEMKIRSP